MPPANKRQKPATGAVLPEGKNIMVLVDSASKELRMPLNYETYGFGESEFPPSEYYERVRSIQYDADDEFLVPTVDEKKGVSYGPLLFIIYSLGIELKIKKDDIPNRIIVLTTDTLKKAFQKGDDAGADFLQSSFRKNKLDRFLVLYGPGAVDAYFDAMGSFQRSCVGYTGIRTLPHHEFARLSSNLNCQATALQVTQKAFEPKHETFVSHYVQCEPATPDGGNAKGISDFQRNDCNDWRRIIFQCAPAKHYMTTLKISPQRCAFEVIVSIWDGALLKHIVLEVNIEQGLKEKNGSDNEKNGSDNEKNRSDNDKNGRDKEKNDSDTYGLSFFDENGNIQSDLLRGNDKTFNATIDVVKVVCSGICETDEATLSRFKTLPKGNDGCILHLLPRDRLDATFQFAHVTFMCQRNHHNRNPAVFDSLVDGRHSVRGKLTQKKPTHRFEQLSQYLQRDVPNFLESSCTSAFPDDIGNRRYVVNATFRIVRTTDKEAHTNFTPIAIGCAPIFIPLPEEAAPVHTEVVRTLSKTIQRGGWA